MYSPARVALTLLVLLGPLLPAYGQAVDESDPFSTSELFKFVDEDCPRMATNWLVKPEVRFLDIPGQNHTENMCACAKTSIRADTRFIEKLNVQRSDARKLFGSEKFKAYFQARLYQSFLSCTAIEFEKMLAAPGALD